MYERAARYFKTFGEPNALHRMDPNLRQNPELVDILAEWEEAWEFAMPYVLSIHLQKSLNKFVNAVLCVSDRCLSFKDACLSSDVELSFFILDC